MVVVCERWAGDGDRLLYWSLVLLLTIAAFISHHGLGLLNHWSPRAQSPQSASWFSRFGILSPTDSNCPRHLVILLPDIHLLPLFFRLFTQVHLLIDGSVEGQYITGEARTISLVTFFFGHLYTDVPVSVNQQELTNNRA